MEKVLRTIDKATGYIYTGATGYNPYPTEGTPAHVNVLSHDKLVDDLQEKYVGDVEDRLVGTGGDAPG